MPDLSHGRNAGAAQSVIHETRDDRNQPDRESAGQHDDAPPRPWSRREWLNTTAGMILATSGLPVWLVEEAEADTRPADRVQESKAGRRKKHRQHHKRRRRNHGGQGAGQTLGVRCDVFVIGVRFLAANFWAKDGDVYKPVDGKLIQPGHTASVHTARSTMRVDIALATSYPVVFLVENAPQSLPVLTMGHHGSFSESGWTGGTVEFQQGMAVGEMSPPMKLDGASFRVTRLDDTKDYTVFSITASPPNT